MVGPGVPNNKLKQESNESRLDEHTSSSTDDQPVCGIIMPISAIGDYEAAHWARVKTVLERSIEQAGYRPRLVSESEAVSVIQAQIVQNIYEDDIVVCDVSAKNPNVMFELGLRLAFDKPTIVVKDDITDYSFDTSPIKHIPYRHDLRFDDVELFKREVAKAILGTVDAARKDKNFSPFLRHFGKYTPRKINTTEVDSSTYIIEKMNNIERQLFRYNEVVKNVMAYPVRVENSRPRSSRLTGYLAQRAELQNVMDAISVDDSLSDKDKNEMIASVRKLYEKSALDDTAVKSPSD